MVQQPQRFVWFIGCGGNTSIAELLQTSTMRIKTNIETLEVLLTRLQLRGVGYNLKKNKQPSIGMIARK